MLGDNPQAPYSVELPPGSPAFPENPQNPLTRAGVQLGRWLFYDPILSGNNTMSCASCHIQQLAFTDGKRFSPGIHGQNTGRNAMSLVNLAWGHNFFWDGRVRTLEEQAVMPIKHPQELDQPMADLTEELKTHPVYPEAFRLAFGTSEITEERIGKAIAQFVKTIVSFNSPLDDIRRAELGIKKEETISSELRPLLLPKVDVETRRVVSLCGRCHNGTNYYGETGNYSALYGGMVITSDGLDLNPDPGYGAVTKTPGDFGHFKAPDLRNIALTGPYMHDGRFATLDAVLDHYDHGIKDFKGLDPLLRDSNGKPKKLNMSPEARKNLLTYLKLMTDTDFLNNKSYSDPYR